MVIPIVREDRARTGLLEPGDRPCAKGSTGVRSRACAHHSHERASSFWEVALSIRDEARQFALVQLSAESPVFMAEGLQRGYVTEVMIVPVAAEARLVHSFAARLDGIPYLVDWTTARSRSSV